MEKINETSPALIAFCKDAEKLAKKHGVQVDFSNFWWYYPTVNLSVMDVGLKKRNKVRRMVQLGWDAIINLWRSLSNES